MAKKKKSTKKAFGSYKAPSSSQLKGGVKGVSNSGKNKK